VTAQFSRGLSYGLVNSGSEKAALALKYQNQDECAQPEAAPTKFDIDNFYGTLIITIVATCLGLTIRIVRCSYARYHGKDFVADPNAASNDDAAQEEARGVDEQQRQETF